MFLFLIGLVVGMISGIALIAILASGAKADQWMEYTLKEIDHYPSNAPNIITTKN